MTADDIDRPYAGARRAHAVCLACHASTPAVSDFKALVLNAIEERCILEPLRSTIHRMRPALPPTTPEPSRLGFQTSWAEAVAIALAFIACGCVWNLMLARLCRRTAKPSMTSRMLELPRVPAGSADAPSSRGVDQQAAQMHAAC